MTTRTGARIYRGRSRSLAPGACPHCGRSITLTPNGRRRDHVNRDRRSCTGSGVLVAPKVVHLAEPVQIVIPKPREPAVRPPRPPRRPQVEPCICGWHPRRKKNGDYQAHRIEPDNPAAPYCAGGAPRSPK